ncbi:MAG: hypothetical protein CL862_13820 [Cyanobium sp. NAT70]|nr:hypothetical protein [Cyanobium sp. NAT70]|tara:strand:+ start:195 stop:386 length:192 start_codon:yes stop_codon:yes gene_type:complete
MSVSKPVASIEFDHNGLRLAYKTTSDALDRWGGGDPVEQEFLMHMKDQLFRCLMESTLSIDAA